MIQFTPSELARLREKKKLRPKAVEWLRGDARLVAESPVLVPETGIAGWLLHYYCPDCSVRLEFDRRSPKRHRCPACGRSFSGSPYDESWWWIVNEQNFEAVFRLGLLYQLEEDAGYARKAIEIMLTYARYYRGYEVHGKIPYNGPGKAGAQTLDEANFLRGMALGYDLLAEAMTEEERTAVREGLLLPGAEFLREHVHRQLHNHEVMIHSAIAVIGLVLQNEEYIRQSVFGEYGLLYQLERGVQENGLWFEGSFGYHFYALTSFMTYEKAARHTPYSQLRHPNYRRMLEILADYAEPGFGVPMLNDTSHHHVEPGAIADLLEFPYRELGGEKLGSILSRLQTAREDSVEAFLYGADELPPGCADPENHHVEMGPGNTVLRGVDGRCLLFKHDRYGGEHDHYDRLAISYLACGRRIAPDLGTTGYGAVLHYDYYKNTGAHNTVCIGESNQAPVNAALTRYECRDGVVYLCAEADWGKPYEMPDSFTIVQWSEENYRTVRMQRRIAWTERYFAEAFFVSGVRPGVPIDWVMHFSGVPEQIPAGSPVELFSDEKPYRHLRALTEVQACPEDSSIASVYRDGDVVTQVFGLPVCRTVYFGVGPDNPSVREIPYRIERAYGGQAVFAHVIASAREELPLAAAEISVSGDQVIFDVSEACGARRRLIL